MSEIAATVERSKASLFHLEVFADGDDLRRVRDAIAAVSALEVECKRLRALADDHFRNARRLANLLNKHERERGRP